MTMPAPTPPVQFQTIELPAPTPGTPMLMRMISDPLFPPEAGAKDEPLTWVVSLAHPLVPDMKVIRMFVEDVGIAVYSVDGKIGMRNLIPMERTRLVEEAMPLEVFADELYRAEVETAAEAASADNDDDDPAEAAPQNAPPQEPQAVPPPATVALPPDDEQPDAP